MQRRNGNLLKLAGAIALLYPGLALAAAQTPPSAPVTVVNTTANPVPVTGSATVSGTVTATQSGTWNVGIVGTPSVSINSSPTNPVFVTSIAKPVPVQFALCTNSTFTARCSSTGYVVPNGKRLRIQYVSWRGDALSTFPASVELATTVSGQEQIHAIPGERSPDWVGGRNVTIFADPNTSVFYQSDGAITPGPVVIVGELEDVQ